MEKLKTQFRMNGLPYTLIKRNDKVELYGIGGEFTYKILHWEVDIIYIRRDKYGEREHIAKNDDFGSDRSRYFMNEGLALEYYDKLTSDLSQGVVKSIAGVEENAEVIPEPCLVYTSYPCYLKWGCIQIDRLGNWEVFTLIL
jgi:hypothetical protein